MAERWRDEDRPDYGRGGDFEGRPEREFDRERSFGERGYRDWGRGYERDYGSERGRYGGFQGRALGNYNPRSDYDRGPFPYDAEYGAGPRYGGGFEPSRGRPCGYAREYERDYARTPAAARDFRGRGPKGYMRPDVRIHEDVCDRLTDDPTIDASDIEVKVANGEVILTGTVDSRDEKRRVEDSVEAVSGVRNVQNLVRIDERAGASGMATELRGRERTAATATGAASGQSAGTRTPETV